MTSKQNNAQRRYVAFWATLLCFTFTAQAFSQTALPWQSGQSSIPSSQDSSQHNINGIPLYIDGKQTKTSPKPLSLDLLDQVKDAKTLGDAVKILGSAYIAPDDNLNIGHWTFQDGTMLTLWPQGGEKAEDTVSVSPRPDCGVAASLCKDLVLNRKPGSSHKHGGSGGSGGGGHSGGSGSSGMSLSPLMKLLPAGR